MDNNKRSPNKESPRNQTEKNVGAVKENASPSNSFQVNPQRRTSDRAAGGSFLYSAGKERMQPDQGPNMKWTSFNVACPSTTGSEQKMNGEVCPGQVPIDCDKRVRLQSPSCGGLIKPTVVQWCNREVICDEVGAGIRPKLDTAKTRIHCCTPISQYMATFGDVAKRFLTREWCVPRRINGPPPCSICEHVVPPCRGYYRKHECIKPEEYTRLDVKDGKRVLRSTFERYWNPCFESEQKDNGRQVADLAGYNVGLLKRLVLQRGGTQCW